MLADRRLHGIDEDIVLNAINEKHGNLLCVAKHLGFYREHVRIHIQRRPRLAKALASARESFKDVCEGVLEDAVLGGDIGTAKFWLATQARDRGFGLGNDAGLALSDPTLRVTTINILAVPSGERCDLAHAVLIQTIEPEPEPDEDGPVIEGEIADEAPE